MGDAAADLRGKSVVVVGLGRSGVAAASLCAEVGARVVATDAAPRDALSEAAQALAARGVEIVAGGHEGARFDQAELIVVSPGVPQLAALADAERRGVPVIGEIELAWRFLPDVPVLAVGGSNGKTTTTTLVGELCAELGARPFVGGNIGTPPSEVVPAATGATWSYGVVVLELSSFQCERMPTFSPARAALLNVSPNHLDRYTDFDAYVRAKGNMFEHQRPGAAAIVPAGDPRCVEQARRGGGEVVLFGPAARAEAAFVFDRDRIIDRSRGIEYARSEVRLAGDHNAANVCAALALVADRAPDPSVVRAVLARFAGLPHRIARVATRDGVTYYDDSKATSVAAAVAAIRGLGEPKIVLIAGGRDKLGSYEPLAQALAERGRGVVLIGEAADRIAAAVGGAVPVERAASMQDAVDRAARLARPGDAVLLSPACSSFDMFRDYAHRAEAFVLAVRARAGGPEAS
jgi:UDP-N-acetylmuramoylalanine--D-glutamate ligase